jgi:PAS domain S-box-containing protein
MSDRPLIAVPPESLEAMVAWMPAAVIVIDASQTITAANARVSDLFGYSPAELIGGPLSVLVPQSARQFHRPATDAYMRRPYVRHRDSGLQLVGVRKDGSEISVDISLASFDYPDGRRAMAIMTDATDRVTRIKAEQAAGHVVEFLAAVTHDLRTPLNSVLGFAQLLEDPQMGTLNERQVRYVSNIRKAGNHMLELLNDVLDLRAVESGQIQLLWERVEVDDVVQPVVDWAEPAAAAKGLVLEWTGERGLAIVGDHRRFHQIVGNLVSNAVKYTSVGSVSVETRLKDIDVTIAIADTGPGIERAELERMFDPFVQGSMALRQSKSGSGLGLALTKRLVAALGGQLTFESTVGSGTLATVAFPAART